MNTIKIRSSHWSAEGVARTLPAPVVEFLQEFQERVYVAGGWIRDTLKGKDPKDIDLWTVEDLRALDHIDDAPGVIRLKALLGDEVLYGDSAMTWRGRTRLPVQLVHSRHGQPLAVLETFDFSICQIALWWQDGPGWQWVYTPGFEECIADGRVEWTGKDDGHAGRSVRRLVEFAARGYNVPTVTIKRACAALVEQRQQLGASVIDAIEYRSDSE